MDKITPPVQENESTPPELSSRHEQFVKEYLICNGNATMAYQRVYPRTTYASARALGSKLLTNINIKRAIDEEYCQIFKDKDTEIEKGKTYSQIHAIGQYGLSDVIDIKNGTVQVKELSDIPPQALRAIQCIEYIERKTEYGIEKRIIVKMVDRLRALELRAKIQGMLSHEDNNGTLNVIIHKAIRPEHTPPRRTLPVEEGEI